MSERHSLAVSSTFVFQGSGDDGCHGEDTTPIMKTSTEPTCNREWVTWAQRWVKQVSRYWGQHSQSSSVCERPDSLEYDFVMPSEMARQRVPNDYNAKTVRLGPDGSLYLRNRYKQKF